MGHAVQPSGSPAHPHTDPAAPAGRLLQVSLVVRRPYGGRPVVRRIANEQELADMLGGLPGVALSTVDLGQLALREQMLTIAHTDVLIGAA